MSRRSSIGPDPALPRDDESAGGVGRREFCRLTALLGGCALGALAMARTGLAIGPGRPDFGGSDTIFRAAYPIDEPGSVFMSTCLGCHGACPVRVSIEDGVLAKIDGNPWSPRVHGGPFPLSEDGAARLRGASCARGQARLQNTHDPFRLVKPLRREGARGAGAWRSLEPGVARDALGEAVQPSGDQGLVVAVDPRQQDRRPVLGAFARVLEGSAVHLGTPDPWLSQASAAMLGRPGWELRPRFDRASAALIWGADAVASGVDPVGDARLLTQIREHTASDSLVVVDPRLSEVAGAADIWLPVRPGGDMALAWMLLRAWYDDGLVAPPDAWKEQLEARPWKDLEPRSGLGEVVVRRTAERLAEMGDGLAIRVGGGVGERPDGAETCESILRLAVLAGSTKRGGAMEPAPAPAPVGERPDVALRRLLADDGVIERLLVVGDGGIVDGPHHRELLSCLADPERVRSLVVVTPVMNPVAALADLVVPDVTEHERSGLVERWDGTSLVQPAVPSVMAELELGEPWNRGLEGVLETLCGLQGQELSCTEALSDAVNATGNEAELRTRGWVAPTVDDGPLPEADAFRAVAMRSPGRPVEGLVLVTFRESFGGFVDSTAQYWATPSLRSENAVWMHPTTFEQIGSPSSHRVRIERDGVHREYPVKETEAIRPGVLAVAVGYGHAEGFDGNATIDGVRVQPDPRRTLGVEVGALRGGDGAIEVHPAEPEPRRPLAELFASKLGTCDRL